MSTITLVMYSSTSTITFLHTRVRVRVLKKYSYSSTSTSTRVRLLHLWCEHTNTHAYLTGLINIGLISLVIKYFQLTGRRGCRDSVASQCPPLPVHPPRRSLPVSRWCHAPQSPLVERLERSLSEPLVLLGWAHSQQGGDDDAGPTNKQRRLAMLLRCTKVITWPAASGMTSWQLSGTIVACHR